MKQRQAKNLVKDKYDLNGKMYLTAEVRQEIFISEFQEFKYFESDHI